MIPTVNSVELPTNLGDKTAFRLSNNPYLLELLGPKLYKTPALAVVRELLTNALDAHRIASVTRPVEIKLTPATADTPLTLMIRDFGWGMTPAQQAEIFMVVGSSSKDQDNQQHGGYGIGALTIFAAADQAVMTTCAEGWEYRYLLYRDSHQANVPTCSMLAPPQPVTSPDQVGTTIELPLTKVDLVTAWYYVFELTALIPELAKVIDPPLGRLNEIQQEDYQQMTDPSYLKLAGPGYKLFTHDLCPTTTSTSIVANSILFLKIGDIAYRIDYNSIVRLAVQLEDAEPLPEFGSYARSTIGIFHHGYRYRGGVYGIVALDLPIGRIQLMANREELVWTAENIQAIAELIQPALKEFKQRVTQAILSESLTRKLTLYQQVRLIGIYGLPELPIDGVSISGDQVKEKIEYHINQKTYNTEWASRFTFKNLDLGQVCSHVEFGKAEVIYVYAGVTGISALLKQHSIQIKKDSSEVRIPHLKHPPVNKLIVRQFFTEADLDAELASPRGKLLKPRVIRDTAIAKKPRVKKDPTAVERMPWATRPKPPGLSVITFAEYPDKIKFTQATTPLSPVKYYLTEDEFGAGSSRFYGYISKLLPAGLNIYRVSGDAVSLVASCADWVSAHVLFDTLVEYVLNAHTPLFREIGLVPGLSSYFSGYNHFRDIDIDFCNLISETQSCLQLLAETPDAEVALGESRFAQAKIIANLLPIFAVSRCLYADDRYPQTSALINDLPTKLKTSADPRLNKTVMFLLAQPIRLLPLIAEHYTFQFSSLGFGMFPNLTAFKDICHVMPLVARLQQEEPNP